MDFVELAGDPPTPAVPHDITTDQPDTPLPAGVYRRVLVKGNGSFVLTGAVYCRDCNARMGDNLRWGPGGSLHIRSAFGYAKLGPFPDAGPTRLS